MAGCVKRTICCSVYIFFSYSLSLLFCPVAPITDYEEQIQGTNSIRDTVISATRRTVCYNQSIYDDMLLETSEYIGLTLAVRDATIPTEVEPMYDHAAIMILDDESKL